ncbi:MAG: hypothetical protein B7O98_08800 [Zestosphaera tikiterensis]|uniref:Uncharacterized protein n=1 Tax=Zestosphaera tikiterensis TaxID=1973259 RepID=A0A2R7Y4F9_9CREN|nr:MAG: hypothetical protein B7O98_08800 [Zestosphaera tikiterensis]
MVISGIGLSTPEEPKDVKNFIKSVRAGLGESPNMDYDSLAVWSFNRLPKYLWKLWGDELIKRGITWQKFLRILKLHTIDIVEWALRDSLSWEELVKRIEKSIDSYSRSGNR